MTNNYNAKYLKLKLSKTQRVIKTLLDEVKFLKGNEKKNTEYILAGLCATELDLIKSLTNNERAGL
jgi:hypothetical protein